MTIETALSALDREYEWTISLREKTKSSKDTDSSEVQKTLIDFPLTSSEDIGDPEMLAENLKRHLIFFPEDETTEFTEIGVESWLEKYKLLTRFAELTRKKVASWLEVVRKRQEEETKKAIAMFEAGKISEREQSEASEKQINYDGLTDFGEAVKIDVLKQQEMLEVPAEYETPSETTASISTKLKWLRELENKRLQLIDELERLVREGRPLIRGSLYEKAEKCRKRKCQQCESGKYHPATFLSVSVGGKTKHRRVKATEEKEIEQGVRRYKDWLAKQEKLVDLCYQQAEIVTDIRDRLLADMTPPPGRPGRSRKK